MEDELIRKNFELRVRKGILPTISILGHTFYVDLRMDMLRPKDNFLSKGIVFSQIENYFDDKKQNYTIPYNPKKHEFEELDYLNLKKFPENLVVISFPSEKILDRIGWNRKYGNELMDGLLKNGLNLKFIAKHLPWEKTFIKDLIKNDLQKENVNDLSDKKISKKPKGQKFK